MASLAAAHPPAAALLLRQGPDLIEALGAVHNQLLPAVHRVARSSGGGGGGGEDAVQTAALLRLLRQACHVELASERLTQLLLLHCYVTPAGDATGSSSSGGAGSSSAGSSGGSAVARGEALLHALMLLGHREEESGAGSGGLSLGQALSHRLGLGGSILAALRTGALSLDDAQADYIAALLGVASLEEAPGPPLPGSRSGGAARSTGGGGGGGGAAAQQQGMDMALLKSQIQQVRAAFWFVCGSHLPPPTRKAPCSCWCQQHVSPSAQHAERD